jgi:hypothetical protein
MGKRIFAGAPIEIIERGPFVARMRRSVRATKTPGNVRDIRAGRREPRTWTH